MANIKKFSDYTGVAIELICATGMPNTEFSAKFPGVKGIIAKIPTTSIVKNEPLTKVKATLRRGINFIERNSI